MRLISKPVIEPEQFQSRLLSNVGIGRVLNTLQLCCPGAKVDWLDLVLLLDGWNER